MSLLTFFSALLNENTIQDDSIEYIRYTPTSGTYISFGHYVKTSDTVYSWIGRVADAHLTGGEVVRVDIDYTTKEVLSETVIFTDPTYNIQSVCAAIIGGQWYLWITTATYPTFHDLRLYKSTDGLTGEAYDSGVSVSLTLSNYYNVYSKPFTIGTDIYIPFYTFANPSTSPCTTALMKYNSSGVFQSEIVVYTGTERLSEAAFVNIDDTNIIAISRNEAYTGLWQVNSTDGGATWGATTQTNIADVANISMCEVILNGKGLIDVAYCDRQNGTFLISKNNTPATVLASPTSWNEGILQFRSIISPDLMLGYPDIVNIGGSKYIISFSDQEETPDTTCYLMYGVGTI